MVCAGHDKIITGAIETRGNEAAHFPFTKLAASGILGQSLVTAFWVANVGATRVDAPC